MKKVGDYAKEIHASVHMPKNDCGLAGGKWAKIEPLVAEHLADHGTAVTVYDLA